MPLPKDPIKAEEARRKLSERMKKWYEDPEVRLKQSEAQKGSHRTSETRKKMSEAQKLRAPPSEETRRKMSGAQKKRMADPETRKTMGELNKGRKQSPETIAKRVEKLKGQKRPLRSEESRRKYSEAGKKLWENQEYRMRMSEVGKKRFEDPEWHKRMSELNKGRKQSPESIAKRVAGNTGQQRSPRIKRNCAFCGKEMVLLDFEKNRIFCSAVCRGKWQSENSFGEKSPHWQGGGVTKKCEVCGKEFSIGKSISDKTKFCSNICRGVVLSKTLVGKNNPNWTGGPKDYCEKWSLEFRRRIRAFFNYECAECGTPQKENLLECHHVYYDKKACCSIIEDGRYFSNLGIKDNPSSFEIVGDPNKFVALCDNCHKKTSGKKNRAYWARHFEEIINNYFLGKSYFTKEEYEKLR